MDVVAHRGSSGAAPENTLAAVRLALRQKSDVMENDIQRTADGELVIMHDTTLARTTDVEQVFPARAPWNVGDFTLAEIKQLDAGSWFATEFAGERVPTLARVGRGRRRRGRHAARAEGARALPRASRPTSTRSCAPCRPSTRALRADRVQVQSFNHAWLRSYADLAPDVPGRPALRHQAHGG